MSEYSLSVTSVFNSSRSLENLGLYSSKTSLASPPQPTYLARSSCSLGVALRCSTSRAFTKRMAATFVSTLSLVVLG